MHIVSASRRTDIPAFYSEWFMNRIAEGYALSRNPFNPKQISRIDLRPHKVACIVFWTRDPRPLLPHLDELDRRGYRYIFHITLTGMPKELEPAVPEAPKILDAIQQLASRIGPDRITWRFDPILLSSLTPPEHFHRTFQEFAEQLQGSTKRVMISFAQFYGQVGKRLQKVAKQTEIEFEDIYQQDADSFHQRAQEVLAPLVAGAQETDMELTACAPTVDLTPFGVKTGTCIDPDRIGSLFNLNLHIPRDKGQRAECQCAKAIDIGHYGTCHHGCLYCYASRNSTIARGEKHHPDSPFLIGKEDPKTSSNPQLSLL